MRALRVPKPPRERRFSRFRCTCPCTRRSLLDRPTLCPKLVCADLRWSLLPSPPFSLSLSRRVFPSVAACNTAFRCSQGNAHLAACTGLRGARAKCVSDSRPQPYRWLLSSAFASTFTLFHSIPSFFQCLFLKAALSFYLSICLSFFLLAFIDRDEDTGGKTSGLFVDFSC